MTALRSPVLEAASVRSLFVCTTCARRLLDKGYPKESGSIDFGTLCEAHPSGQPSIYATSIVKAPESEVTTPTDLGRVALEDDELSTPEEDPVAGPSLLGRRIDLPPDPMQWAGVRFGQAPEPGVTEIATRLVVAWSTAERIADKFMVDEAIKVAREIVRKTRGA